jgi:hypothetical protein
MSKKMKNRKMKKKKILLIRKKKKKRKRKNRLKQILNKKSKIKSQNLCHHQLLHQSLKQIHKV